jgi:hypothetical protein
VINFASYLPPLAVLEVYLLAKRGRSVFAKTRRQFRAFSPHCYKHFAPPGLV